MTRYLAISCVLLVASSIVGCDNNDRSKDATQALNKTNIQKLANSYGLAAGGRSRFKPPKSKEELIDFIKNTPGIDRNLDLMGIDKDSYEDLFISSVDGEEFVIRWGQKVGAMGAGVPIAFEKSGADGIRRVALSNGTVVEADDETYDRLMAGKATKEERGPDQREVLEAEDDSP